MRKRNIAILIIVFILSSAGLTYADKYSNNYSLIDKYEDTLTNMEEIAAELNQKIATICNNERKENKNDDYHTTEIQHHTCGDGGSSCKICYSKIHDGWCGCQMILYKCCCGKALGAKEIFCPQHRR